jgi:hypothetical protein
MKRESGAQIQLRTAKEAHNETSTVMAVLACISQENVWDFEQEIIAQAHSLILPLLIMFLVT